MKRVSLVAFLLFNIVMYGFAHAYKIRVVTESWQPYNFKKNGRVTGVSTEIVERTLSKAGVEMIDNKILILPWVRAYKTALTDPNVLIYTILRTPERENYFKWIGPLIPPDKFYLYKNRKRLDIRINSLEDAKGYRTGILRGSVHEQFMLRHGFPQKAIQGVANQELNLKKLLMGRIDFIIDTDLSLEIRSNKMNLPLENFEKTIFLFENDYYMAISLKTDKEIVERVGAAFNELMGKGEFKGIVERYK